jgi:hypothetical protein
MIQLRVLSGKKAGTTWVARHFPVRIGRSAAAELQSEEAGVWDQHLCIDFAPPGGITLQTEGHALATINGQPADQAVLRNGDVIDIGSLRLQFELSDTRQARLGFRDGLTWACLTAITVGQVGLIYWLLH